MGKLVAIQSIPPFLLPSWEWSFFQADSLAHFVEYARTFPCAGAIKQQVMKITGELWVEMRDGADLHSFFHFDININIGV